ncbi:unnamed protein product [Amoebophrya sp. A25]|nr:unnamed protein product [Amoebophrya sp. A25]|eukprot:GSA25T00003120001.1
MTAASVSTSEPRLSADGSSTKPRVLITGAYGFVGAHSVKTALDQGFRVRGTVRGFSLADTLKKAVAVGDRHQSEDLELVKIDLSDSDQEAWNKAAQGCTFCLHLATPVITEYVADEDTVLRPAVEGTGKVLRACASAGVQRVVFCSSTSAINAGHPKEKTAFSTKDWSGETREADADLQKRTINSTVGQGKEAQAGGERIFLYEKSKVLAEKTAWKLAHELGLELCVILPSSIWGPNLLPRVSPCGEAVRKIVNHEVPILPRLCFNCVDVRDVAELHVLALKAPAAKNGRFLADAGIAGSLDMEQVAQICDKAMRPFGWSPVTRIGPYWIFYLSALFLHQAAFILPNVERGYSYDAKETREVLKWTKWRSIPKAIEEAALSMQDQKLFDESCKSFLGKLATMLHCPSRSPCR